MAKSSKKTAGRKRGSAKKASTRKAERKAPVRKSSQAKKIKIEIDPGLLVVVGAVAIVFALMLLAPKPEAPAPAPEKNVSFSGPTMIVVHDPYCDVCEARLAAAVDYLKGLESDINVVDLSFEDGKEILKEANVNYSPAILFKNIDGTQIQTALARYLSKSGDYTVIMPAWYVRAIDFNAGEVRVEVYADDLALKNFYPAFLRIPNVVIEKKAPEGNYVIKAVLPAEYAQYLALKDAEVTIEGDTATVVIPKTDKVTVDLYVMSFCPYGNKAEEYLKSVKDLFGDKVEIVPHFIYYDSTMGYTGSTYCVDENSEVCSMHGAQEARQDIRESCVYRLYGDRVWIDFAVKVNEACNASNADACWEGIARQLNIDVNAVKECEEKDWKDIAIDDKTLTSALGIYGSPTAYIEGYPVSGLPSDPNTYRDVVCMFLADPPEGACETDLNVSATVSGSCG